MKREVAIIIAVLVPAAALVALALRDDEATPVLSAPAPVDDGVAADTTSLRTSLDELEMNGRARPEPVEPIEGVEPAATLEAPLKAVAPEVRRCFDDRRAHLHGHVEVKVRFRPTPDGGFDGVDVASTPDPTLAACLEDVFAELRYTPNGHEDFAAASHTFVFEGR